MNLLILARLELRMALAEGALRWILATALLLLLFAMWNGWQWREFRTAAVAAVQEEADQQTVTWLEDMDLHLAGRLNAAYEKPDDPYFVYAFFPWYTASPPPPLSVLSVGQTDLHAYYTAGTMVTPNLLYHEEEIQNPAVLALGRFDLAFFLVVALPVLIIALAFDLVAEDRRTGRDRMLALQAGGIGGIITLRCALRFAWLCTVIVGPLTLLLLAAGGAATAESRAALVLVLLLTAAYIAFWFSLALLVNARGASAARNAVVLLVLWGATVLFAPAAVDGIARTRYPVAAGALRPAEERHILQGISDSSALARLAQYETLHLERSPDVARETRWVAGIELRRDTAAVLAAEQRAIVDDRQRLADRMAVLSPALMLYRALESVAAASNHHAHAFRTNTDRAVRERAAIARGNVLEGRPAERSQVAHLAAAAILVMPPGQDVTDSRLWLYLSLIAALTALCGGAGSLLLRSRRDSA